MAWEIEEIPDESEIYMRVHREEVKNIPRSIFRDRDGQGMSVDWCKYATVDETRARGIQGASQYGVVALSVGRIRKEVMMQVRHSPVEPTEKDTEGNRAHSDLLGLYGLNKGDTVEARVLLGRILQWRVQPDDVTA